MTRRINRVKFIALVVAAVIGIPMVIFLPGVFWELHEARNTLRNFGDLLVDQNYRDAYELTSPELRGTTDFSAFVKIHEGLTASLGRLTRVKLLRSKVADQRTGWFATITANLIFADGARQFVFTLKKENGKWRIYNYREE